MNANILKKDFVTLDDLVDNYKNHGLVDKDLNLIKFSIPVPSTGFRAVDFPGRISELEKSRGLQSGYFEEFKNLQEYEAKLKNQWPSFSEGKKTHNMAKNRVTIGPEYDYINALYIPHIDPTCSKRYISTQGPIPDTIYDFWRMVYYENVPIIVMTALAIESARKWRIYCV